MRLISVEEERKDVEFDFSRDSNNYSISDSRWSTGLLLLQGNRRVEQTKPRIGRKKMRLIDADELIITILTNDLCGDDNVDKAILNAPTVKAIPVEWIRKWNTQHSPLVAGYVAYMLLDWETENETN